MAIVLSLCHCYPAPLGTRAAIGTDRRYNDFPYDVLVRASLPSGSTDGDVESLVTCIFTPPLPQLPPTQSMPDVHTIDSRVEPPKAVSTPDPEITEEARRAKASGNTWVEFTVNEDGTVSNIVPLTTDSNGFSSATAAKVAIWRFKPATLNGSPVKVRLRSEFSFCLY